MTTDVPWNAGNVGRTCLGAGATLHLIRPLGFSLEDHQVRRAGLDYWPRVRLRVWDDLEAFLTALTPAEGEVAIFTKRARAVFWDMPRPARQFLVVGSETRGLPEPVRERYAGSAFRIPISDEIRSLNLSTTVGIALYESLRVG